MERRHPDDEPIRVAISMGDPAGIGPEIVVKSLSQARPGIRPIVIGDARVLRETSQALGLALPVVPYGGTRGGESSSIEVLDLENVLPGLSVGVPSADAGEAAYQYVARACAACLGGEADCLVTAPINKHALKMAGHEAIGHTEILEELTGSAAPVTIFALERLCVAFYTRHCSLREAIVQVRRASLVSFVRHLYDVIPALGFGPDARLAIAALNPHAGEEGRFGREELDEIMPAIHDLQGLGLRVSGPVPADSMIFSALQGQAEVVVALYHDQAAAPLKARDFHRTVSITLGLPFIRTSPDHGTGFDIAGTGRANAESMQVAIATASDVARRSRRAMEVEQPMKISQARE